MRTSDHGCNNYFHFHCPGYYYGGIHDLCEIIFVNGSTILMCYIFKLETTFHLRTTERTHAFVRAYVRACVRACVQIVIGYELTANLSWLHCCSLFLS